MREGGEEMRKGMRGDKNSGDGGDDLGDDEGHSVWKPMGAASRPRKAAQ